MLQKQSHTKRVQVCVYQRGRWEGELDEGSQRVQTPSYKVTKYKGCNVQHDKDNEHCCTL